MSFGKSFKAVVETWIRQQHGAVIARSKEFNDSGLTFYIRAGRRWDHVAQDIEQAITIVRVDLATANRGKGVFREFRLWMEDVASRMAFTAVYVDQVHSEILQESLPRNGYERDHTTDPCEHIYRKAILSPAAVACADVEVEDLNVFAISDTSTNRYISALVGPEIRTAYKIQKAMLITGRELAEAVRDSLRGPQSTRYFVVAVALFEGNRK
jgi:hypothetical protein